MDTYDSRVQIGVAPEGRTFRKIGVFLAARGINRVRLLTNNPLKCEDLRREGITVTQIPLLAPEISEQAKRLLQTKRDKFGHTI